MYAFYKGEIILHWRLPGFTVWFTRWFRSGQVYATTLYPPGDTAPCTHWAAQWVGTKAGTDNLEATKISPRTEIEPHSVVTIMTELFWVRKSLNES